MAAEPGSASVEAAACRQKLVYFPEAHTDFVFAVRDEELGLVGVLGVITLFMALCGALLSRYHWRPKPA